MAWRVEKEAESDWQKTSFLAWRIVQAWSVKRLDPDDFNPFLLAKRPKIKPLPSDEVLRRIKEIEARGIHR